MTAPFDIPLHPVWLTVAGLIRAWLSCQDFVKRQGSQAHSNPCVLPVPKSRQAIGAIVIRSVQPVGVQKEQLL
jgi:hypothetical protein